MGRSRVAKSSRVSSISFGVFALATSSVNLFRSGVGGLFTAIAREAIGSLQDQKGEAERATFFMGAISGKTRIVL
jgi:hypothetical protein